MSKKIQLSIPKPCHENWDAMTPVEQGKFCGSCQKQVVDFSSMSDRQVAEFFKKPSTGSVCGRFMTDQLDRNIEIPKKRIPWFKYFFQLALPAFLVSIKASAQQKKGKVKINTVSADTTKPTLRPKMGLVAPTICVKPTKGEVIMGDVYEPVKATKLDGSIQLKIVTVTGDPIPYASIETGVIGKGGAADKTGSFSLDKSILDINGKIFVAAGGYERKAVEVKILANRTGVFEIVLEKKGWLEEVVVTALPVRQKREILGAVSFVTAEQLQQKIKGKVVDENNNPVPFASVMIKGTTTGVAADEKGLFKISSSGSTITLICSAIGFRNTELPVDKNSFTDTAIIRLTTDQRMMVGELVITKPAKTKSKNIPLISANNDNTASAFKVFPNPVEAGTNLSIEWLQKEEGYYTLQVVGASGQSVYQQEIWIDAEARLLNINVPEVAAGNYFVVLTNKKSGKTFTEKIVIQ